MFEIITFGTGFWLGYYWGKYKSFTHVFDELKDEILSEEEKAQK